MRLHRNIARSSSYLRSSSAVVTHLHLRSSKGRADFLLVANPNAGKHARSKRGYLPALQAYAKAHGAFIQENGVQRQRKVLDSWSSERPSFVATLGGDGTVHTVLNDLIAIYGLDDLPPILPLPGGTMNVLATDLKLGRSVVETLRLAHLNMNSGRPKFYERGLLQFDFEGAPHQVPLFGFIFANGNLFDLIEEYQRHASKAQMLLMFFKAATSARFRRQFSGPKPMTVRLPEETIEGPLFATLISSINNFMMGLEPFDLDFENPRQFGVVATNLGPWGLVSQLYKICRRKARLYAPIAPDRYLNRRVEGEVFIEDARGISIDGDSFPHLGQSGIRISVGAVLQIPKPEFNGSLRPPSTSSGSGPLVLSN